MKTSSAARILLASLCIVCVFETIECGNCSIPAVCNCEVERKFNRSTAEALSPPAAESSSPLTNSFTLSAPIDICKTDSTPTPNNTTPNITLTCTYADPLSNKTNFPSNPIKQGSFYLTLNYPCIDPAPPSAEKQYSTGSILLIIFFTALFSYLLLGMVVNYFMMGARGIEVIPNVGFWRDLPNLVREGAVFIQNGFRVPQTEIYQRSPESYDAI